MLQATKIVADGAEVSAASPLPVGVSSVPADGTVSTSNSTAVPLAANATFTGIAEDVSNYASIVVACTVTPTNATGTVYADFSTDGVTWDGVASWPIASGSIGVPHRMIPTRKYMRLRVVNSSIQQTAMRAQVIFHKSAKIAIPTSRIAQTINDDTDVLNTRAILVGQQAGGTYTNVPVTADGHLEVAIHDPVSAFGEVLSAGLTPRVQIDAVYGIRATDVETFTDGSSGSATNGGSLFTCATGTTVGGYAVIRSRRAVKYRPGQGLRLRFTARWPVAGVANCLIVAGGFNAEDGLFVGYSGTSFGFMRRVAGQAAIHRLTVTTGAGGAETVTVTLNGVAFTVASGGVLSTTALAEAIAERVGGYTGWSSGVSPTSNGATVTFIQGTPGAAAGAFTLSSTGTAAGTFATVATGAANDSVTGFVAQSAWNVDTMDGTGATTNPSGVLLDPSKLNVFEIVLPYLGAGTILLRVMSGDGEMTTVHRVEYPNTATIPNQKTPTYRLGWVAASLGSSTALTIQGASAAGFVEGVLAPSARDPFAAANSTYAASTTEYVALALRVRGEFGGLLNQREVLPHDMIVALETSNRVAVVRLWLNPTMTGLVNWQHASQSESCVEYATPTSVAVTAGRIVALTVTSSSAIILNIDSLDVRLEPGDVLALTVEMVASSSTAVVCINWNER